MDVDIEKKYNEGDLANENTVERKKDEAKDLYDQASGTDSGDAGMDSVISRMQERYGSSEPSSSEAQAAPASSGAKAAASGTSDDMAAILAAMSQKYGAAEVGAGEKQPVGQAGTGQPLSSVEKKLAPQELTEEEKQWNAGGQDIDSQKRLIKYDEGTKNVSAVINPKTDTYTTYDPVTGAAKETGSLTGAGPAKDEYRRLDDNTLQSTKTGNIFHYNGPDLVYVQGPDGTRMWYEDGVVKRREEALYYPARLPNYKKGSWSPYNMEGYLDFGFDDDLGKYRQTQWSREGSGSYPEYAMMSLAELQSENNRLNGMFKAANDDATRNELADRQNALVKEALAKKAGSASLTDAMRNEGMFDYKIRREEVAKKYPCKYTSAYLDGSLLQDASMREKIMNPLEEFMTGSKMLYSQTLYDNDVANNNVQGFNNYANAIFKDPAALNEFVTLCSAKGALTGRPADEIIEEEVDKYAAHLQQTREDFRKMQVEGWKEDLGIDSPFKAAAVNALANNFVVKLFRAATLSGSTNTYINEAIQSSIEHYAKDEIGGVWGGIYQAGAEVSPMLVDAFTIMPALGKGSSWLVEKIGGKGLLMSLEGRMMTGMLNFSGLGASNLYANAAMTGQYPSVMEAVGDIARQGVLGVVTVGTGSISSKMFPYASSKLAAFGSKAIGKTAEMSVFAGDDLLTRYLTGKDITLKDVTLAYLNSGVMVFGFGTIEKMKSAIGRGPSKVSDTALEELRQEGYGTLADELKRFNVQMSKGSPMDLPEGAKNDIIKLINDINSGRGNVSWSTVANAAQAGAMPFSSPGATYCDVVERDGKYYSVSYDSYGRAIERIKCKSKKDAESRRDAMTRKIDNDMEIANEQAFAATRDYHIKYKAGRVLADQENEKVGHSLHNEDGTVNEEFRGYTAPQMIATFETLSNIPPKQRTAAQQKFVDDFISNMNTIERTMPKVEEFKKKVCELYSISETEFDSAWGKMPSERSGNAEKACRAYNKILANGYAASAGETTGRATINGVTRELTNRVKLNGRVAENPDDVLFFKDDNGNIQKVLAGEATSITFDEDPNLGDVISLRNRGKDMEQADKEFVDGVKNVISDESEASIRKSISIMEDQIANGEDPSGKLRRMVDIQKQELEERNNNLTDREKAERVVQEDYPGLTGAEREKKVSELVENPSSLDERYNLKPKEEEKQADDVVKEEGKSEDQPEEEGKVLNADEEGNITESTPEEEGKVLDVDGEGNLINQEQTPSAERVGSDRNTSVVQAFAEGYFGEGKVPEGWVKTMVDNPAEFERFVSDVEKTANVSPDSDAARGMEAYRKALEETPASQEETDVSADTQEQIGRLVIDESKYNEGDVLSKEEIQATADFLNGEIDEREYAHRIGWDDEYLSQFPEEEWKNNLRFLAEGRREYLKVEEPKEEPQQQTEAPKPENDMQPVKVETADSEDKAQRIKKLLDAMGVEGKERDELREEFENDEEALSMQEEQFGLSKPKEVESKTPAEEESPMPMKEVNGKQRPDYGKATAKQTHKYLSEKYSDKEKESFISNQKAFKEDVLKKKEEALAEAKKAEEEGPKTRLSEETEEQYDTEKAQLAENARRAQEEYDAAKADLEKWNEVERLAGEAKEPSEPIQTEEGKAPEAQDNSTEEEGGETPKADNKEETTQSEPGIHKDELEEWQKYAAKTDNADLAEQVNEAAKKMGVTIKLYDGDAEENGYISNGVIYVNRNASDKEKFSFVFGHEATHGMQDAAEERGSTTYKDFKKAAIDKRRAELGDEKYEELIKEKTQQYKDRISADVFREAMKAGASVKEAEHLASEAEKIVTRSYVEDEIAADEAGRMLENPDAFKDMFRDTSDMNVVRRVYESIVRYISQKLEGRGDDEKKRLIDLRNKFNKMYTELVQENEKNEQIKKDIAEKIGSGFDGKGKKYSTTSIIKGSGFDIVENDGKGNVAITIDGKTFDYAHPVTADDVAQRRSPLTFMMEDARDMGLLTPGQERTIYDKYASMLNMYLYFGQEAKGGIGNLQDAWTWVGHTVFRSIKSNGDKQYSYSNDIMSICKKNEAVIDAISAMQLAKGRGITPSEIIDIYRTTDSFGYQVPCPVCYVFSRYIRNGKYASAAINGMLKYGEHLPGGGGVEWTAKDWADELMRLTREQKSDKKYFGDSEEEKALKKKAAAFESALKDANEVVTFYEENIDSRVNKIAQKLTGGNLSAKEEAKLLKELEVLDQEYKDAVKLISQGSLTNWIKSFAIKQSGEEWVMREDAAFPENWEDFKSHALDLRKTPETVEKYAGVQRLRKSGGSAGGKEITQEANNEVGEVAMGLGLSSDKLNQYPNYYKEAAEATDPVQREELRKKARERFAKAAAYVAKQNLRGGQRFWSWSDNLERLSPDIALNLMSMEMLGGGVQTYSKQLEGVELMASMGAYVNGSLMAKDNGVYEVKSDNIETVNGVKVLKTPFTETVTEIDPETGKPVERERILAEAGSPIYERNGKAYVAVFDDIIGIAGTGRNGKVGLFDLNKQYDRAGNIIVGMNDLHIRTVLSDPRIFFCIPWHASGAHNHILNQMLEILGTDMRGLKKTDYTSMQEEKNFAKKNDKGELPKIPRRLKTLWGEYEKIAEDNGWACGTGKIDHSQDYISESQLHYRALRDMIFDGEVKEGTREYDEIMGDEFLKQVYESVQKAGGKMTTDDKGYIYPYEYWDKSSTYGKEGVPDTADISGARYVEYCRRLGFSPKFSGNWKAEKNWNVGNFVGDKGYWKLLIDRRMYDREGNYQDMSPIDSSGFSTDLVDPTKVKERHYVTQVADAEGTEKVVSKVIKDRGDRSPEYTDADYNIDPVAAAEQFRESSAARKQVRKNLTPTRPKAPKRMSLGGNTRVEDMAEDYLAESEVYPADARGKRYSIQSKGLPYRGSKGRIADRLVDALPEGERFVDLFAGGGAMTQGAMESGKFKEYHLNDKSESAINGILAAREGRYDNMEPNYPTDEEFSAMKGTGEEFVKSHSGFGDYPLRDRGRDDMGQNIRRARRFGEAIRPYAESTTTSVGDYRDVELREGDVVYADLPYSGTRGYKAKFSEKDKQEFSDWALSQDVPIFVSERSMPEGWTEVYSMDVRDAAGNIREEKLFVQDKFAGGEPNGRKRYSISYENGFNPTDVKRRYSFSKTREEFDRIRDKAVKDEGIVLPNLDKKSTKIVNIEKENPFDYSVPPKDFKKQLTDYAVNNGDKILGEVEVENGIVYINKATIGEMADKIYFQDEEKSGIKKDIYVSSFLRIKDILRNSVDCEIFPDYLRGKDGRRSPENGYNPNVLMHVFYAGTNIDGKYYSARILLKEQRGAGKNSAYMYKLEEIKLSEGHPGAVVSEPHRISENLISVANLIKNSKRTYGSRDFLLEESKKTTESGEQGGTSQYNNNPQTGGRKRQSLGGGDRYSISQGDYSSRLRELFRRRRNGEDVTAELQALNDEWRNDAQNAAADFTAREGQEQVNRSVRRAEQEAQAAENKAAKEEDRVPIEIPKADLPLTGYETPQTAIGLAQEAQMRAVVRGEGSREQRRSAIRGLAATMSNLHKAMREQREYDKQTVGEVVNFAKTCADLGLLDNATLGEVKKVMTAIKDSTGAEDLHDSTTRLLDVVLNAQARNIKNTIKSLLNTPAAKIGAKGVVEGKMDVSGQYAMETLNKYMGRPVDEIGAEKTRLQDKRDEAERLIKFGDAREKARAERNLEKIKAQQIALDIANNYMDRLQPSENNIRTLEQELENLKQDYKDGLVRGKQYREEKHLLENMLREERVDQLQSLWDGVNDIRTVIEEGVEGGKTFAERQQKHAEEVIHDANKDLEGVSTDTQERPGSLAKVANSAVVSAVTSSLYTLDTMLRALGSRSINGEGFLYDRFGRGWLECRDNEIEGFWANREAIDGKARELFGVRKFSDLIGKARGMKKIKVTYKDGANMKEHDFDQAQALYVYMVNKMDDGKIKLRRMGISEEDVENIKNQLDPRFVKLADWLQSDFLAKKHAEYNEVHMRMFGAPLSHIENYVPLRIDPRRRARAVDISVDNENDKMSTTTGGVIERTRNSQPLDLLNTNAIDLILDHLVEMNHWQHFAEWNRDVNTLLSDTTFRNKIENSKTMYGSGEQLWNRLNQVFQLAGGVYRPKSGEFDKAVVNIAQGVSAAKVSFRAFTAAKQLLSLPVFATECDPHLLLKNVGELFSPVKSGKGGNSFKWCMDNLPSFKERWRGRMAGDTRLESTELDWNFTKNNIVQWASKWGLTPNAFIDACTVAAGAKSVYETKRARYLKQGYSEAQAEKLAKQDATIAFNQSQQSSERMFVAPMQVDRSIGAAGATLFRNASMGYERKLVSGLKDTAKFLADLPTGGKERRAFMERQYKDRGLTEAQAKKAAMSTWIRHGVKSLFNIGMYGFVAQACWNIGGKLPYLMFGDNGDEKKKILKEEAWHAALGGWLEGLPFGDNVSNGINNWWNGKSYMTFDPALLPIQSDIMNILKKFDKEFAGGEKTVPETWSAITDIVNLGVQAGIGVNPETFTNILAGIVDWAWHDKDLMASFDTTKEALLFTLRFVNTPQTQLDQMYIDEIGMTGAEAKKLSPEKLAKRYAFYKTHQSTITAWHLYDKEAQEKIIEKYSKNMIKKMRGDIKDDGGNPEDYEDFMNNVETKKLHKTAQKDYVEAVAEKGLQALREAWEKEEDWNVKKALMKAWQKKKYGEEKMPTDAEEAYEAAHDWDISKTAEKVGRDLGFDYQDTFFQMSQDKTNTSSKKNKVAEQYKDLGGKFVFTKDKKALSMQEGGLDGPQRDKAKNAAWRNFVEANKEELTRIYKIRWRYNRVGTLYEKIEGVANNKDLSKEEKKTAIKPYFIEMIKVLRDVREEKSKKSK